MNIPNLRFERPLPFQMGKLPGVVVPQKHIGKLRNQLGAGVKSQVLNVQKGFVYAYGFDQQMPDLNNKLKALDASASYDSISFGYRRRVTVRSERFLFDPVLMARTFAESDLFRSQRIRAENIFNWEGPFFEGGFRATLFGVPVRMDVQFDGKFEDVDLMGRLVGFFHVAERKNGLHHFKVLWDDFVDIDPLPTMELDIRVRPALRPRYDEESDQEIPTCVFSDDTAAEIKGGLKALHRN